MIIEGLGRKHWDNEIRMCIEADKEHLEYFAEKSINDININEDLKFNLQKSISNNNLKFNITIANKSGMVVEMTKYSVQRLIYFSEKRKKKEEILSLKWSKAEKVEYQKWLRENFWGDIVSRDQAQLAIRQSIRDETEDDFSDDVIRYKQGVAMPIFTMRDGDETIEIDITPGSDDGYMTLDDMMKVTRGLHFVILRSRVKGGYLKGVLELENCGDRVKQIISAKMIRIISEAKIEPKLSRMELERIDTTMEGPNSLLGVMWKAGWISVQGLNATLHEDEKVAVIQEIMKSLRLNKSAEGKDIITHEKIREGISSTQLRHELKEHINIILIRLIEEVEISWDKGYVLLPDQLVWTQKKIHFIEKLPEQVRQFSTRRNSQNELSEIDPIIITFLRQDEVDEILSAEEAMVIGGMTKHTGSLAMAERTNLAVIMYGCGYELDSVFDSEGNLKSIKNFVLTYVSIVRVIGKRLRPEVVLLLLTKDHTTMQVIRDNLLDIKEAHYEGWFKIKKFGVSYFYVQSIEHALSMKTAPDAYNGIRNIAMFDIEDNCSAVEIVSLMSRVTG
jgi:hypothetical protein